MFTMCIFWIFTFVVLLSRDQGVWAAEDYMRGQTADMSFKFIPDVPSRALGIFTTIMVQIERKLGSRVDLWRINTNYTTEDTRDSVHELCRRDFYTKYSEDALDDQQWGNCSFSVGAIYTHLTHGTPEIFNKNITYLEIRVKPFVRQDKDGNLEECVLTEIPETMAYIALMTFTFNSDDGTDKPIYKLDRIMPEALNFFEEVIDLDGIYQFWPEDFLVRRPPYKCLLDIGSGASVESLEKNCSFSCSKKKVPVLQTHSHTEF